MDEANAVYLSRLFNPANRDAVLEECFTIISSRLEAQDQAALKKCWQLTQDLFSGKFPGYGACNTEYHDFNHTCDVFGASIRMCDGALSQKVVLCPELLLDICIAAMLHDAGYIQESDDTCGTGAKFTKVHVRRSIEFTEKHKKEFDLNDDRTDRIKRLIAGTDLSTNFDSIPFIDETEKFAAKLLASADLLGQMADRTYLEKLLFLYYEFQEAGFPGYSTEFDMLKKTLGFYEMTKERLFNVLGNATKMAYYHFATHYGMQKNLYLESIERQIDYLQSIIDDDTVNFRKKLKRIDLDAITQTHQKCM